MPPCPCHRFQTDPAARLTMSGAGLLSCRACGRSMHPIVDPHYLAPAVPFLGALAERHREREAQAEPIPAALAAPCPKCDAKIGQRCRNYTGANCAPHSGRGKPVQPELPKPVPPATPSMF